ncbi:hypothetical protein [Mycobacterium sp.]|uniref:hypothetical protein n=1 Tax=Mycobacterium sp. TaxID=1785 RepID=UPI003D6C67ED
MGEHEEYVGQDGVEARPAPSWLSGILTPEASAISGFAFAALSMMGQGTLGVAIQAIVLGDGFGPSDVGSAFALWGIATLVLAVIGFVLAGRTLRDPYAASRWPGHLARAAVIVAVVGVLVSLIGIVAGQFSGAAG